MNHVLVGAVIMSGGFIIAAFGFGYGLASMESRLPPESDLIKIIAPGFFAAIVALFLGAWMSPRP